MGEKLKKTSLRERLRRLLGIDETVTVVAAAARERRSPLRDSIHGARLSLVGLGELRAHLGDRWPDLAERVHSLAEAVISRHVTPGDVFDAHGDEGYVVLFSQLSKIEADFKCRVIAKEIASKLLGSDWSGLANIDGVSIELGRQAVSSGDFDQALSAAIARGAPLGRESLRLAPLARGPAAPATPMVHAEPPRPACEKPQVMAAVDETEGYEPIWDFRVQALLHFRLAGRTVGDELADPAAAELDFAGLSKALLDLEQLARLGRRLPIVCPIHASTLNHKAWRDQLVRTLKDFPAPLLKLVALEVMVVRAGDSGWPVRLDAVCKDSPARCFVRVGPDADLSGLGRARSIAQVVLELPADFRADRDAIASLERFVGQAEAAKLPCGVSGLRTRAMTLAASAAGFGQLSGPAVHAPIPVLGHAIQFDLSSLYRDLLPPLERAG